MNSTDSPTNKKSLLRGIGAIGAAILVLNSVIGGGIFALPAEITARAGLLSPWLFLLVGALVITIVLSFAELASYFKENGGPVLYTTTAFGPVVGFSTGWILFISRMTAFAANATVMAVYLGRIFPWFASGMGRALLISIVCGGLTWVNYVGVREGVRTMAVITFFKLVPIFLLVALGLTHVTGDTFLPPELIMIDNPGSTALLLIYAFVGFESATIMSGETRNPQKTLPLALIRTIIIIAVLYFLIVLTYVSVADLSDTANWTLIEVGEALMGPFGAILITFAAFFSVGGNLSSIMLAVPRLPFAMAEKGMLPKWFSEIHPRYATPGNAIIVLGMLGLVFALSGSFAWLAAASSLTRLICYVLCIASLPAVRKNATEEVRKEAFHLKGGYLIPGIAMLLSLWIGAQSDARAWIVTGTLLGLGLILYFMAQRSSGNAAKS